jgi:hypothetical protein
VRSTAVRTDVGKTTGDTDPSPTSVRRARQKRCSNFGFLSDLTSTVPNSFFHKLNEKTNKKLITSGKITEIQVMHPLKTRFLQFLKLYGRPNPRVVLTTPPGELHELGTLVGAATLSKRKINFLYLGVNTPLESLRLTLKQRKTMQLCWTITRSVSRGKLRKWINEVRRGMPGIRIFLAGQATLPLANYIRQSGAIFLGTNIQIATDKIDSLFTSN